MRGGCDSPSWAPPPASLTTGSAPLLLLFRTAGGYALTNTRCRLFGMLMGVVEPEVTHNASVLATGGGATIASPIPGHLTPLAELSQRMGMDFMLHVIRHVYDLDPVRMGIVQNRKPRVVSCGGV